MLPCEIAYCQNLQLGAKLKKCQLFPVTEVRRSVNRNPTLAGNYLLNYNMLISFDSAVTLFYFF